MIKTELNLTDILCTQCGLCCDGSLFADVELTGAREAATLEVMGLEIEDDEDVRAVLLQPCAALQGKRCSIYPHRPGCCRTFECRLLQKTKRGVIGVKQAKTKITEALKQIERVKELIARLGQRDERLPLKERCAEAFALSEAVATDPSIKRMRAELQTAMTSVERLIQKPSWAVERVRQSLDFSFLAKTRCFQSAVIDDDDDGERVRLERRPLERER